MFHSMFTFKNQNHIYVFNQEVFMREKPGLFDSLALAFTLFAFSAYII